MEEIVECPRCRSRFVKKNGPNKSGKQMYRCKPCGRQFVLSGKQWHVSDEDKELINRLLLERISLNGICRAVGVSQSWLLKYIKELYSNLPDDLCADQSLPELEEWLDDRMEEEISRLEEKKSD